MADGAEQWRPEVEEGADARLKAFSTGGFLPKEVVSGKGSGQYGDSKVSNILEFDDIGANNDGTSTESESGSPSKLEAGESSKHIGEVVEEEISPSQLVAGESSKHVGEVVEEEIVELEFEKVKPKLTTHSMHCPNCKSEITKVILRRKVLLYRPATELPVDPVATEPEPKPEPKPEGDLVGCLSCLSLFTCSGNGCFNPFDIFRKTPDTTITPASPTMDIERGNNESCLSMFWVIRKGKSNEKLDDLQPDDVNPRSTSSGQLLTSNPPHVASTHTMINIDNEAETVNVVEQSGGRSWTGYEGVLAEILKSIVYGGLMEVITSLSIVASAAASDASTLNIIVVALATLIGGVFVIGHNIWDLRDDCHKNGSNNEASSKYKELLGQVNYFPLHAFFAILSFLVFGMVPPAAYGFSFHKTNDKDFTIVVVAAASLVCVVLLAISKAYVTKCTVSGYFKTVVYYIVTVASVSGVSYAAGNLLTRLMEEYGLFDTSSGGGMSLLSHATTSSLAYY